MGETWLGEGIERERKREYVIIHMSNLVCYSHDDEQCLR